MTVARGLIFILLCFAFQASMAFSKLSGFVRAEEMIYPTKLQGTSNLNESLQINSQFKYNYRGGHWENAVDFGLGGYVDSSVVVPTFHELYASYITDSKQTQHAGGRKLEFWSQSDQDWQLGLWQPQAKLDSLRPEDQGLTGYFFKHTEGMFQLLVFASPFYIPTTTPEVKAQDGKLVADGRWYRSPSDTFLLFGRSTQIVYSLDIPNVEKLVFHGGGGIRLKLDSESNGPWASFNYGYKPMNVLLLQYKKSLALPDVDAQTGEVTITPYVGYHSLYGADFGYRYSTGMVAISVLQDQPEHNIPDSPYVLQNPDPMTAISLHADSVLELPWLLSEPFRVTAGYLHIEGGTIHDYDSQNLQQGAIFSQRFDFMTAASLKGEFSTKIFGRSLLSSIKYTREFEQKGTLLNAEINYYPRPILALVLGMDLLGVDDDSAANRDTRFLNQFRANDRYYGGISYVF